LLAAAGLDDPAAVRAVQWLLAHQSEDGSWEEEEFTGTGFPCVFYLKYHLYRNSFPLYALARYDNLRKGKPRFTGVQVAPSEIEHANGFWGDSVGNRR
jgi:squalene-hopene/tetraprenyl-beta-curcumene cyclase